MTGKTCFDSQNGKRHLCSQNHGGQIWGGGGGHLASHLMGIGGSFPEVKRSERNPDAVTPFRAEFKNE